MSWQFPKAANKLLNAIQGVDVGWYKGNAFQNARLTFSHYHFHSIRCFESCGWEHILHVFATVYLGQCFDIIEVYGMEGNNIRSCKYRNIFFKYIVITNFELSESVRITSQLVFVWNREQLVNLPLPDNPIKKLSEYHLLYSLGIIIKV